MVTPDRGSQSTQNDRTGIYAHIVGWGMSVPEGVLSNDDLAAIVETSDEWIQSRTGIKERRIANERESSATLGLKAAQQALDVADLLPAELDLVIVATSTPENIFPSTASLIQAWLGAGKAGAFDLSAACSGFVYGVSMAAQAIRSGSVQTALVVGTETMTRIMDWNDRGTCILFGDGAGAVVLQASDVPGGVLSSILRSDGYGGELLGVPTVGSSDSGLANGHKMGKMHMNGGEVFKFGARVITESVPQALEQAGLTLADVSLIIPHQANARIIAAAARSMKLDENCFMSNLDRYGNTSAASIPIALCEAIQQGRVKTGDNIVLVGFGGGLSWASMAIKWGAPKPEERQYSYINRRRRQISYIFAYWRAHITRWGFRLNETINRTRPKNGRISRLRRKMDQHDLE
jgi:3-oxoacyl-[acyl-carrier-protein] synthase-3